jgi:hypothetical protein
MAGVLMALGVSASTEHTSMCTRTRCWHTIILTGLTSITSIATTFRGTDRSHARSTHDVLVHRHPHYPDIHHRH